MNAVGKPVIGITTGTIRSAPGEDELLDARIAYRAPYLAGIERAGGAPVLLPYTHDKDVIAAAMARMDGLLLSGGGDILPSFFGQEPHPENSGLDSVRDCMEFEAVRIAMKRGIAIFGICRGIQVLNVALGGSLVQHIPDLGVAGVQHKVGGARSALVHAIDIDKDSLLAQVLGATAIQVNSRHHQAVQDVAQGLRISARAPDGIIEGLEAADGRPLLAVQCHPEDCCDKHPRFQKLFTWLVEHAAKRR